MADQPLHLNKQDKYNDLDYIRNTTTLLKDFRIKNNMTQAELSKKTAMSQQMISRIDTN